MLHLGIPTPAARCRIFWKTLAPVLLVLAAFMSGCSKDSADSQAGHPGPGGPQKQGQGPGKQAIPVAVAPAGVGSIASYYQATATLEAEKEARILARATGVVGTIFVEEGDEVAEGDPLLTIDNQEYRFRLQQAEANTLNLRSRFNRFEAMREEELSTEEEYQAAKSDLASAEADEGTARLNLSYTTVRAPFSGRITSRLVDVGHNLSVGSEVMVMADFDPLLARVHVPSREFNKLQKNQSVDLVLDSSGAHLIGRIMLISPVIDPASGTIKITVEVPDYPAQTRPGDFTEVRIVTEMREGTLLVPRTAVITDKGEKVVYVAVPGEAQGDKPAGTVAERRIVTVGFTDDDQAEILEGLDSGEQVVVKGQRSLKHGSLLKILEGQGSKKGDEAVTQK